MKRKSVAIIPLRAGSKGIPGKNKKRILGRPLYQWSLTEAIFSNLDEIYVFTPKGDIRMMPLGSNVLDFAFEIHSGIGTKCIGAKINHKLVPLSHELENGSQIEILTSSKQKPNEDWLNIVTTSKAKCNLLTSHSCPL